MIFGLKYKKSFRILFISILFFPFLSSGQVINNSSGSSLDSTFVNYFENGKPNRIQLFYKGLLNGPSWEFHPSGQLMFYNQWAKGRKDGIQIIYNQAGKKIKSSNWLNGRLDGEELVFYRTGIIQSRTEWVLNLKHGKSIWYHDNSIPAAIYPYSKGEIHGDVIFFDVNGSEESRKKYLNNEPIKIK
ncbi:MAG: Uncharacterised protein [Owenweeksia sp. TMED14]|nr:MAG: Uncharacterised protein [Owenweeksia sp. TMED14]